MGRGRQAHCEGVICLFRGEGLREDVPRSLALLLEERRALSSRVQ